MRRIQETAGIAGIPASALTKMRTLMRSAGGDACAPSTCPLHDSKTPAKRVSLKGLAAAALLLMLAISGAVTSAQKLVTPTGIKNFGQVNDKYYRGSQPTKSQVAALRAMGVKTIIDLRRDYLPEERLWAAELGMNYFNLPLKASKAATKEQTEYFLGLVNDPANGPVFVHCKGGRHRTGAMTAVYRITHDGWTAQQAFVEMKKYDFDHGLFGGPSDQKKFVFDFYEQHRK